MSKLYLFKMGIEANILLFIPDLICLVRVQPDKAPFLKVPRGYEMVCLGGKHRLDKVLRVGKDDTVPAIRQVRTVFPFEILAARWFTFPGHSVGRR